MNGQPCGFRCALVFVAMGGGLVFVADADAVRIKTPLAHALGIDPSARVSAAEYQNVRDFAPERNI